MVANALELSVTALCGTHVIGLPPLPQGNHLPSLSCSVFIYKMASASKVVRTAELLHVGWPWQEPGGVTVFVTEVNVQDNLLVEQGSTRQQHFLHLSYLWQVSRYHV